MGKGEKKGIKCQQMLCEPVQKLLSRIILSYLFLFIFWKWLQIFPNKVMVINVYKPQEILMNYTGLEKKKKRLELFKIYNGGGNITQQKSKKLIG